MNLLSLQIMLITVVTACACALPGVFIVLRGVALMSDAISHAILLGIVLMFFLVRNLHSPLLLCGAALAGLGTVVITEQLIRIRYVKKDAAIGLVFPFFFSLAVILISLYARDIHLDIDMVLLGEVAFAPFKRFVVWDFDCGPSALWVMSLLLVCNSLFIALFYKELQLSIFDPVQAHLSARNPYGLYYGLMALVSITAVGAFDVVGSIVVVALMITPVSTAYLCTHTVDKMIWLSLLFGALSAIGGYGVAYVCDVSIAGSIAAMSGFLFVMTLFKGLFFAFLGKLSYILRITLSKNF